METVLANKYAFDPLQSQSKENGKLSSPCIAFLLPPLHFGASFLLFRFWLFDFEFLIFLFISLTFLILFNLKISIR